MEHIRIQVEAKPAISVSSHIPGCCTIHDGESFLKYRGILESGPIAAIRQGFEKISSIIVVDGAIIEISIYGIWPVARNHLNNLVAKCQIVHINTTFISS